MRYNIGNFVVFNKIVQRYSRKYADKTHKLAYVSLLREPFPVGQVTGFKHLKFGVSLYDADYGYSFSPRLVIPCYEIKIGVLNIPYYIREEDLLYRVSYFENYPINILKNGLCDELKMKVNPDEVIKFLNKHWDKRYLNDDTFFYEEGSK